MLRVVLVGALVGCAPSLVIHTDTFDRSRFAELMRDELDLESSWAPRPSLEAPTGGGAMCDPFPNPGLSVELAPYTAAFAPLCLDEMCRERLVVTVESDSLQLVVESYRMRSEYQSTGMICPGPTHNSYELEGSEPASRRVRRAAGRALDRMTVVSEGI